MAQHLKLINTEKALSQLGLKNLEQVHWNLPTPSLYEHVIRNREGHLAHLGALVVRTDQVPEAVLRAGPR